MFVQIVEDMGKFDVTFHSGTLVHVRTGSIGKIKLWSCTQTPLRKSERSDTLLA